ncbi:hypothetical protein BSY238_3287 [Methyloversatilis sp. RAC08]|uniref:hypothetical protein n=1 Tax=Methyloversatilis sp. RAC08 TaxID=1842540 RepID=UPI00083DA083|nr:hypothetical protein [Methyloversatilis sp. RAC08]AOF81695.1 hypothetical protein BSY238_3287 [Methyloversatilis sp. RAC08]
MSQARRHPPAHTAPRAACNTEKPGRNRRKADGRTATADATPDTELIAAIGLRSVAPDDRVVDVMSAARREHLIIVTNGQRFALCSVVPAGWRAFGAREFDNAAH